MVRGERNVLGKFFFWGGGGCWGFFFHSTNVVSTLSWWRWNYKGWSGEYMIPTVRLKINAVLPLLPYSLSLSNLYNQTWLEILNSTSTSLSESSLEALDQVLVCWVCKDLLRSKIFTCFLFKVLLVYLRWQLLDLTGSCYINSDDVWLHLFSVSVYRVHLSEAWYVSI